MHFISTAVVNVRQIRFFKVTQLGQSPAWAAPQLGSRASSGRAWRLWAARYSQSERLAQMGAQPLPRLLELAASKAADSAADPAAFGTFWNL